MRTSINASIQNICVRVCVRNKTIKVNKITETSNENSLRNEKTDSKFRCLLLHLSRTRLYRHANILSDRIMTVDFFFDKGKQNTKA